MGYQPEHWNNIQNKLSELGVDSHRYVVIQPTARQVFKCWDEEKFSAVIDSLEARGYRVVLTSGPSAGDITCVNKIKNHCQNKPVTEFAGKTSFPELAALIDHAALFIGVDSAPMHISAALKRRTFAYLVQPIIDFGGHGAITLLCFGLAIISLCLNVKISIVTINTYRVFQQVTSLRLQKNY